MRYGEIARKIRQETKALSDTASHLNVLADELERIDSATPIVKPAQDIGNAPYSPGSGRNTGNFPRNGVHVDPQ